MSVELPFAPVDSIIRRNAGNLRVSAEAAEALAERIQTHGAQLAETAAAQATADNRKTIQATDFGVADPPGPEALALPVAPVDRIARLNIADKYRVGKPARYALAKLLESYADDVAKGATILARHAGRRTIQADDIETYFALVE